MRLPSHFVLALTALLAVGCVGTPKIEPHTVGFDAQLVDAQGTTEFPSVLQLPRLTRRTLDDAGSESEPGTGRPVYRLGPLDQLSVLVWGSPDLGSQSSREGEGPRSLVQEDGTVFMPFLGHVRVVGNSVEEVRILLETLYSDVVENPQIEVEVVSCRSQAVDLPSGVARPGRQYLCVDRMTLSEVVSAAGGPAEGADSRRGVLTRHGAPFTLDWELALKESPEIFDTLLEEGDVVSFPAEGEQVVHVFGELARQGSYPIPSGGLTLLGALGQAGGPNMFSSRKRSIYLAQQHQAGIKVYELSLADILVNPEVPLRDGDRIFVPPTDLSRWDRWWDQALPFSTTIRIRDTP